MQGFSCYNEANVNAPALLATAGSAAELVTGLKENKSDMPKHSTPVSTPTNNRRKRALALIGQRFNMLTVIGLGEPGSVQVRCDCGVVREYQTYELKSGGRKSCGCLLVETRRLKQLTHGKSHTRIHNVWLGMCDRCRRPKNRRYADYGGRGIKVCERWQSFENFYADMGEPPTLKHTLERINNDGDYEPGNCRWATYTEQANNRRSNVLITAHGETRNIKEWAQIMNISESTIQRRMRDGLVGEAAISRKYTWRRPNKWQKLKGLK